MPLFQTVAQAVADVGDMFPQSGYVFQDMKGTETRYGYQEVARHCAEASPERRRRARRLGPYQAFIPTLAAQLADVERHAAA